MRNRSRAAIFGLAMTLATLALAAPAFAASNDGEGLVGETNDKIVTFVSLGLVIFFVLLIVVLTFIQSAMDKRKQAKKKARLEQRIGW
jgi:nitrogen fixation/metabolism regulation signal transduction histidine kinase